MDSPAHHYLSTPCSSVNESIRTVDGSICESPVGVVPELSKEGTLDLSNRGIPRIPSQYRNLYERAVKFNVSRNALRYFDLSNFTDFIRCIWINASQNDIAQIKYINCALYTNLQWLNLADNKLLTIDQIYKFIALQYLDVSHNRIERFALTAVAATGVLPQLTTLRLASNHLRAFPQLSALVNLRVLDLNGNRIRTLEDLPQKLPPQIETLDIGGNMIDDLCEFHYLAPHLDRLTSVMVAKNVCVAAEGRDFDYRPFIHSCVLGSLKVIDGFCLSEKEILKGEWLHTEGKGRHFKPKTGLHGALCEYLTEVCPIHVGPLEYRPALSADEFSDKMLKVIKKRRQYLSSEDDDNKSDGHDDAFVSPIVAPPPSLNASLSVSGETSKTFMAKQQSSAATAETAKNGGSDRNNCFAVMSPMSASMEFAKKKLEIANAMRNRPTNSVSKAVTPLRRYNQPPSANLSTAASLTPRLAGNDGGRCQQQSRPHSADSSSTVILSCSESMSIFTSASRQNHVQSTYFDDGDATTLKGEEEDLSALGDYLPPPSASSSATAGLSLVLPLGVDIEPPSSQCWHGQNATATLDERCMAAHDRCRNQCYGCSPLSSRLMNDDASVVVRKNSVVEEAEEESEEGVFTTSPPPFLTPHYSAMRRLNGGSDDEATKGIITGQPSDSKNTNNGIQNAIEHEDFDAAVAEATRHISTAYDARLEALERRTDELSDANSLLTTINEQQTKTIVDFSNTVLELKETVARLSTFEELARALVPTPTCLRYERNTTAVAADNSSNSGGGDSLLISWENIIPLISFIDGYELWFNDQPAGRVVARNKRALISDINHDEGYKISIETVSRFRNVRSQRVDLLVPRRADEEETEAESVAEAGGERKRTTQSNKNEDTQLKENVRPIIAENRGTAESAKATAKNGEVESENCNEETGKAEVK